MIHCFRVKAKPHGSQLPFNRGDLARLIPLPHRGSVFPGVRTGRAAGWTPVWLWYQMTALALSVCQRLCIDFSTSLLQELWTNVAVGPKVDNYSCSGQLLFPCLKIVMFGILSILLYW